MRILQLGETGTYESDGVVYWWVKDGTGQASLVSSCVEFAPGWVKYADENDQET